MQHEQPRRIGAPRPQMATSGTGHCNLYSPLDNSSKAINPERQSDIRLHNTSGFLPDASSRICSQAGRRGHDQGHEDSTSTEHSSFMSDASIGTIPVVAGPQSGCKESCARLTAEQKNGSVSKSLHHRLLYCLWNWEWEALSMVLSIGLLAAIVATLASHDHGTQPEWPYQMNINSLISLFTTIVVALMGFILAEIISQLKWQWFTRPHTLQDLEHYDAASRGIMGAILFLGRFIQQPRAYLAVGAAFLLLASSAIGPFTQQSVKSYTCQRPLSNTSASIAAASWVDSGLAMDLRQSPDLKLITAALEGIVGAENSSRTVPFNCSTGTCDFPPYSSLGYCSSCTDITSHVEEQYDDPPIRDETEGYYNLNYTLPGENCQLNFYTLNGTLSDSPSYSTLDDTTLTLCQSSRSGHFNSTTLALIRSDCSQMHADDSSQDGPRCDSHPEQLPGLGKTQGLIGLSCSIGLCVRDYTGRVRNGVLSETTTNTFPSSYQIHAVDDETTIPKLPCIVDSKTYDMSNMSQVLGVPGRKSATVILDGQRVTIPQESVFKAGAVVPLVMRNLLQRLFTLENYKSSYCSSSYWNNASTCDPRYLGGIFRGGRPTAETISSDFERVAVAISNRMRAVGSNAYGNGSGVALGTAVQTTVCVRVDWYWFILPVALVLLTVVLFITLVCINAGPGNDRQPVWKSSAIVAFFHGVDARSCTREDWVDGGTARAVGSADETDISRATIPLRGDGSNKSDLMTLEGMHARAKKVVVKLQVDTAATGRRGFILVKEVEDDDLLAAPTNKLGGQGRSSTHLPSNSSLRGRAPSCLQVDLGIGLTPSIHGSLSSLAQTDLDGSFERGA